MNTPNPLIFTANKARTQITLEDYLVGMILSGWISVDQACADYVLDKPYEVARRCFDVAEVVLQARQDIHKEREQG